MHELNPSLLEDLNFNWSQNFKQRRSLQTYKPWLMSNAIKMKSAIMAKSHCEEEESLDEKYQEQIRESQCLRMSREIRRKELEIVNLKEKCETLQNTIDRDKEDRTLFEAENKLEIMNLKEKCESLQSTLNREKTLFEVEKKEWEVFKKDLLLVVRAADDYKTEAKRSVEKYKNENSALEEKVYLLEQKLSVYEDSTCRCRKSLAITKSDPLSDKNGRDAPSPSDESTSTSDYLDCVSRF